MLIHFLKKIKVGVWGVLYQCGAPELLWELFPSQWPFLFLLWDPQHKKQTNKNITTLGLQWEIKLQGRGSGGVGSTLTAQRMFELMSHHHLDPPPGSRHTDMQIGCPVGEGRGQQCVQKASALPATASCAGRRRRVPPSLSPSVSLCASPSLLRSVHLCLFSTLID